MSAPSDPDPTSGPDAGAPASPPPSPPRPTYGPQPLRKPARTATRLRDMIGAMVILAVVVLVAGGIARSCAFAPAGPTLDESRLPVVDAPAQLASLAPDVPVPLRAPAVPEGWRSNSVGQDRVDDGSGAPAARAVVTGYLTPEDRFLRFAQSDATEEALAGWQSPGAPAVGRGAEEVGGVSWIVYSADDGEPIWIASVPAAGDRPAVRWLLTGSADDAAFRTLAAAVARAPDLPLGTG